jgi:hypothetical protein
VETTLGSEREQHVAEVKKLKALLSEKVQIGNVSGSWEWWYIDKISRMIEFEIL